MALPGASLDIQDGGLGLGKSPITAIAVVGTATAGPTNSPLITRDPNLIKATFVSGQLVDAGVMLAAAGIVAVLCRAETSSAGTVGSVTASRVGGSDGTVAVAGNPTDAFELTVEIRTGTESTADNDGAFRYSLDGKDSWSNDTAIPPGTGDPASSTYALPGTGLTLTFSDVSGGGTFDEGDKFSADCTAPAYSTANLGTAYSAIAADSQRWRAIVFLGEAADAAGTAAMAATIKTLIENSAASEHRYSRAFMGTPLDETDANLKTAFANFESTRVGVCAGPVNYESGLKSGRYLKRSALWPIMLRIGTAAISHDLGRVKSKTLKGIGLRPDGSSGLYRDERLTPGLDAARFTTLTTYAGKAGYFCTQGRLMSPEGSDFDLTQFGFIMDAACEVLYPALVDYVNEGFRTLADGTLDPRDANPIKTDLENKLKDALMRTTPQHVSAVAVEVRRDTNIQSTRRLSVKFRVQPKGYAKLVEGEISYAATLDEAA